jgi:hypothetical protein
MFDSNDALQQLQFLEGLNTLGTLPRSLYPPETGAVIGQSRLLDPLARS